MSAQILAGNCSDRNFHVRPNSCLEMYVRSNYCWENLCHENFISAQILADNFLSWKFYVRSNACWENFRHANFMSVEIIDEKFSVMNILCPLKLLMGNFLSRLLSTHIVEKFLSWKFCVHSNSCWENVCHGNLMSAQILDAKFSGHENFQIIPWKISFMEILSDLGANDLSKSKISKYLGRLTCTLS